MRLISVISQKLALVEMMTIRWILEAPYFQTNPAEKNT